MQFPCNDEIYQPCMYPKKEKRKKSQLCNSIDFKSPDVDLGLRPSHLWSNCGFNNLASFGRAHFSPKQFACFKMHARKIQINFSYRFSVYLFSVFSLEQKGLNMCQRVKETYSFCAILHFFLSLLKMKKKNEFPESSFGQLIKNVFRMQRG